MPGLWDEDNGAFVTYIKAQAAITALIGAGSSCRCWPSVAKEKAPTLPYMIFARGGGERFPYHGGISGRRTLMNVWFYGATVAAADALTQLFITTLTNFKGTWSGIVVMRVEILMAPEDGFDGARDGSAAERFWCRLPIAIIHNES